MQSGRMSSRVTIELFGPDDQPITGNPDPECPDTECETCSTKETQDD